MLTTILTIGSGGFFTSTWFYIIIAVVLLVVFGWLSYVKAPPSYAYIISGLRKKPRVLIGKGSFRLPFLSRLDSVYLGQITVDIKTEQSVPTNDFINVDVDAVAKVHVIPDEEGTRLAAKNFLNMAPEQIAQQLKDSLQGNMREIIGTLDLRSLNTDRDGFSNQVQAKAQEDMTKLGIEIISCNIQNVTDKEGLIKDLGADNTAKIKKEAAINKAKAEAEVQVESAKADQEANDARVNADTAIAVKKNELALKEAALKAQADTEKAKADAAYKIQEQEQQKTINERTVEAKIAQTKREQELTQEQIKIKENELSAEIRKKAEADKFQVEQAAAADLEKTKREAEADAYRAEQEAKAQIAKAEAKKQSMELEAAGIKALGDAEAYKIQRAGEADAIAIEKKGLAEAEAMQKKAEAYERYGQAAILDMMVKIMPEIAKSVAEPISAIKNMNVYGTGGEAAGISGNVPTVIAQAFDVLKSATGVDMTDVVRSHTIDAKVKRDINVQANANATVGAEAPGTTEAPEVIEVTEETDVPGGDQE